MQRRLSSSSISSLYANKFDLFRSMICRAVELNYHIITCSGLSDISINYGLGYEPFWRALSSYLFEMPPRHNLSPIASHAMLCFLHKPFKITILVPENRETISSRAQHSETFHGVNWASLNIEQDGSLMINDRHTHTLCNRSGSAQYISRRRGKNIKQR